VDGLLLLAARGRGDISLSSGRQSLQSLTPGTKQLFLGQRGAGR